MQVKVKEFRKAYEEAVKNNKAEFEFKGLKFHTKYAMYLLQYTTDVLKRKDNDTITFVEKKDETNIPRDNEH